MGDQQQTIGPDSLQGKIQQLVINNYQPVYSLSENPLLMTSEKIWAELQKAYPGEYSIAVLAVWLEEWGFRLKMTGPMKFEWMLKRKYNGKN